MSVRCPVCGKPCAMTGHGGGECGGTGAPDDPHPFVLKFKPEDFAVARTTRERELAPLREQIAMAAIVRDGKMFYGFDHAQAYAAAQKCVGEALGGFDQGFLTTRGRYVSRDEAYEIAVACGQVVNDDGRGFLISEMLPGHPLHIPSLPRALLAGAGKAKCARCGDDP